MFRPHEIELIKNSLTPFSDHGLEVLYCEMLDSCYEPVRIAGYEYATSDALKAVDPIAFQCGLSDFTSDDRFTEIDGEYYDTQEVENLF